MPIHRKHAHPESFNGSTRKCFLLHTFNELWAKMAGGAAAAACRETAIGWPPDESEKVKV